MGRRIGQGHALVLGRNVDQLGSELGELGRRAEATIQVGFGPARTLDDPPQDDLIPFGETRFSQDLPGAVRACHVEEPLDLGLVGAGADQVRGRPPPEHEPQSADDDGFPGARLTRQDVEALLERERELFDKYEISNPELYQHAASAIAEGSRQGSRF